MKRLNNKGFTLVEIIAVMAIIVILLGIAIGTYTAIILDSQKSAFVAEAMVQVKGIRTFIESEDIDVEDDNTVYYFNYKLGVDSSESPFEKWENCYVVVTYNSESDKNTYYWTGLDKDKWGIKLHKEAKENFQIVKFMGFEIRIVKSIDYNVQVAELKDLQIGDSLDIRYIEKCPFLNASVIEIEKFRSK